MELAREVSGLYFMCIVFVISIVVIGFTNIIIAIILNTKLNTLNKNVHELTKEIIRNNK